MRPQATMRSTSAMLPVTTAPRPTPSPYVVASRSGVSLSAASISQRNWENVAAENATTAASFSGPQRERTGPDLPPDPFAGDPVPVGEVPLMLMAVLVLGYVVFGKWRKHLHMSKKSSTFAPANDE
ncbi:MAG: hypothetical protein J6T80_07815 [Paludibacteraceae bacterium]|nr:hypothetical protein [Paludibacteraceae bacterium]